MLKIIDNFKLRNGDQILIIEDDRLLGFNGRIDTGVGIFEPGEYTISDGTSCFSNNQQYAIRLKTEKDLSNVKEVKLIQI